MLIRLGRGMTTGGCNAAANNGSSPWLDGVVASVCCDLDATIASSYAGSGDTWANLTGDTAYDFALGDGITPGTFPTFNGPAGDSAAYWSFDGGDFFTLAGANPAFVEQLHYSGQAWWAAITLNPVSPSGNQRLFSTWNASDTGMMVFFNEGSGVDGLYERSNTISAWVNSTATLNTGAPRLVIVSGNGAGNISYWINSATGEEASDGGGAGANVAQTQKMVIGARDTFGAQAFASGTRLYSFALGNEYLDDVKAAAIIAHLEARHGRDYTS